MGQLVRPKVYFVGATEVREAGLFQYLRETGQEDFIATYQQARAEGLQSGMALASVYAKMCYKSLVVGKNANVTRVRDVQKNLEGCFQTGHGSVFEHCQLNFIVHNCSRVKTHEVVRHRNGPPHGNENAVDNDLSGDGMAFSQTSGRYCRLDCIDLVWSDLLDPVKDLWLDHLRATEDLVYLSECRLGLRKPNPQYPNMPDVTCLKFRHADAEKYRWVPDNSFDFDKRKAITSAIRRIAPNGQANEIGLSMNVRAIRHVVQVRTARFAETEIRDVFAQIYHLLAAEIPLIFHGARTRMFDGLPEVYGMKMQPYDMVPGDPAALEFYTSETLREELVARDGQLATT